MTAVRLRSRSASSARRSVKLICRPSYEFMAAPVGTPFDYPLSSRFDENDAVLVFDFQCHRAFGREPGVRIDDVGDETRAFVEFDDRHHIRNPITKRR